MRYSRSLLLQMSLFVFYAAVTLANAEARNGSGSVFLQTTKAPIAKIIIVSSYPHDPQSFTEGLMYYNGYIYESTGLKGKSVLKKMELTSGKVIKEVKLAEEYFGEGMVILHDKVYQLTWQNETCFIYNLSNLRKINKFYYSGEGWGLATDGKILFMSDGSSQIVCRDPISFKIIRKLAVHDGKRPIDKLNELEFIGDEIWANVFMQDVIVRISPQTGEVLGWIDLSPLLRLVSTSSKVDVVNGIAYDSERSRIFVTGKFWPRLFEIKIRN
jgi:glutaminyl-peptide cyclotransferase